MKISIDAMGGDHAPEEIVHGAMEALDVYEDVEITLVGDENEINKYAKTHERLHILHASEVITNEDEPVRAVRRKKQSSLVLATEEVKQNRTDACISAGNTGALMSAGLFVVGRIKGVERPALSPTLPTLDGTGFLMLDVGANVDAKASHLLQYGIIGSIYSEKVRGITEPRVGLLNVGTEEGKGSDLTKQAFALLEDAPINFIGNVEARDLLDGAADVVVTDGFTGNVALKTIEGTASNMFKMIKETFMSNMKTKMAAALVKNDLKGLKDKLDYSEYGGAGLLGLSAPVIKAHGSSDRKAIVNAVRQAREMVEKQVSSTIQTTLEQMEGDSE